MIVWCSFCRKFLSEKPPFDDLSYSHGVCGFCSQDLRRHGKVIAHLTESLKFLEAQIAQRAMNYDPNEFDELITNSITKGFREVDLLMGVLTPLLAKSNSGLESTGCNFRDLGSILNKLIASIRNRNVHPNENDTTEVLLAVQDCNPHQWGAQVMELWLSSEAIKTKSIVGSDEVILEAFAQLRPKVFGISLSHREQIMSSRNLIEKIRAFAKLPPLFIAGGSAVKSGAIAPDDLPEAKLIVDAQTLFLTLKTHLSYSFLYDLKYGGQ